MHVKRPLGREAAREAYESNREKKKEAARKAYNVNDKYKYRIVVHTFHMQVSLSSNGHEKLKTTE